MTLRSSPRRRPRRGAGAVRGLIAALAAGILFAAGVAVGQALEDRPQAGDPVTSFATIRPWTQTNRVTATQTVTVTAP